MALRHAFDQQQLPALRCSVRRGVTAHEGMLLNPPRPILKGTHTCAQERLRALFEAEGFRCNSLTVRQKTVENRALDLRMPRRWIQAVFTFVGPPGSQTAAGSIKSSAQNATGSAAQQRLAGPRAAEHVLTGHGVDSGTLSTREGRDVTAVSSLLSGGQQLEAADAMSATRDGQVSGNGAHEWDASPDEGVPGSDVGGLFQEPVEMVEECFAVGQNFTVKASPMKPRQYLSTTAAHHANATRRPTGLGLPF